MKNRRLNRVLWVSLGVFFVLLGIAIAVPFFVHLSDYKAEIAQKASDAIGRKVEISGDISLSILPLPHVAIGDISIAGLFRLKQLNVSVEFWPLFKRQIHVRSIVLKQPDIQLEKLGNGSNNWTFKFAPGSSKLTLDTITIEDGRVSYLAADKKTRIKEINLSLGLGGLEGPYRVKGSLVTSGKEISLDAELDNFSSLMRYSLALSVDKMALKTSGQLARTDHSIKLDNNILETRGTNIPYGLLVDWKDNLKLEGTFKNLPGQGQIGLKATQTSKGLAGTLELNFANFTAFIKWLEFKTGELPLALSRPIKISTEFAYGQTLQLQKLSLTAGQAHLQGNLSWYQDRDIHHVTANLASPSFENLLEFAGTKLPSPMLAGPISFAGTMIGTTKQFTITQLNTILGSGLTFRGTVAANLTKDKPELNAVINTSPLTIEPSSVSEPRWSKTPIDLSALKKINGQFELSTSRITRKDLVILNPRISAKIQDGTLSVNPFAATLWGGELAVKASISSDGAFSLKSALNNAQMQQLISSETKMAIVDGHLSAAADLLTRGNSQFDLVSNLNGTVSMNSRDGIINGFDLDAAAERLTNLDSVEGILGLLQTALAKGKTSFRTYNGDIVFKQGIGTIRSMRLVTNRAQGTASGAIDLPHYTMNILANLEVTNPAGLPSFGLHLMGPLDSPSREYDTSSLRNYLIKNVTQKAIQDITKGQVPNLLKGIF